MVLLAVSSLSMSQQHKLNKVSVDRNTHKTRYVRYDKNIVTRGSQEPNLISPSSNGSVFANSVFVVTF